VKASELKARLRQITTVVCDCDGVLTDGAIYVSGDGSEAKAFNVHDGSGLKYLQRAGLTTAILSGRSADAVERRAAELGIPYVFQGCKVKLEALEKLMRRSKTSAERICYIGDDLPDIPVMRKVGVAIAVANARLEVRRIAHWVTRAAGGAGAIREVAEKILKAQGKWGEIIARYNIPDQRRSGRRPK